MSGSSTMSPSRDDAAIALFEEMNSQRFDVIRFPAYRVASKLRFIQRRTDFHLVDVWNVIESIRENGLHAFQEMNSVIPSSKLRVFVSSIYHQLSKRLPPSQRLNLEASSSLLSSFLLSNSDPHSSKVSVLWIKVTLTVLCSGRVEDKLTYLFSLVSDPTCGVLTPSKLNGLVRELVSLAEVVGEGDSFQDDPQVIFDVNQQVKLKDFLQAFISPKRTSSPSSSPSFSFLTALSRMADVERVVHPVRCEGCHRNGFTGFRYKCHKCYNYNLCQDCFWRGRTSASHNPDTHPCKEFCFWQSQSKEFSISLRRSFRCLPSHPPSLLVNNSEPIKKIDLNNILPPSPLPRQSHFSLPRQSHFSLNRQPHFPLNRVVPEPFPRGSPAYASLPRIHLKGGPLESTPIQDHLSASHQLASHQSASHQSASHVSPGDEEHQLIQLYIKKLSEEGTDKKRMQCDAVFEERRKKISQLEERNREMMEEITRLKKSLPPCKMTGNVYGGMEPVHTTELTVLRARKDELEHHLTALQDSRKELLVQLDALMRLLKIHGNLLVSNPSSAASTLNRRSHLTPADPNPNLHPNPNLVYANQGRKLLNGSDSVLPPNHTSSLVRGFNSETQAAYDEFGLEFNRRLRLQSEPRY